MDTWNTGQCIDFAMEYDRIQKRMRGEEVQDPYQQYLNMKQMEPDVDEMYRNGQIRESKYQSFKQAIAVCEMQLNAE